MVDTKKLQTWFFFIVFGLMAIVIFWIYQPFLQVLFSAAIFAAILSPLFKKTLPLAKGIREIAATLTVLFAGIFIVIPLYFFVVQIFKESTSLYTAVISDGGSGSVFEKFATSINQSVSQVFPNFSFELQTYAGDFLNFISEHFSAFASGTAFVFLEMLLVALSTFLFLKDAPFFLKGFKKLSPLDDTYDEEILETVERTINSVVRGALSIAIIQGCILMLGFYIFGIPNAFLWGSLAMISAVIPGIGTALIFIPGVFYLFYIHHVSFAFGLLAWSFFVHGSVDNFLAPILYGKGMSVHPLFIMFAVLGGLNFFGPLGFLFGPVVLSAFLALYDIYEKMILSADTGRGKNSSG